MGFGSNEASSSSNGLDGPLLPPFPPDSGDGRRHLLSSQPKTFANVFIAIVGAGVLGLPYAFRRTGWLAGLLLLLTVAALTYHGMMLLVRTRRRLDLDRSAAKLPALLSFGDLGLAVAGSPGLAAVDAMIVLSQAGFCVGYLIFICNTLAYLFPFASPVPFLSPKSLSVLAMLPFQLGLNSVRSLTLLAPLSIFADVVDMAAMAVVFVEDAAVIAKAPPPVTAFAGPSVLLYGIGVCVYAFEGVGMVLPLETEAADKPAYGRTLGFSMAAIAAIYGLFGLLGYLAFGDETSDIITTNFGGGVISLVVQLGLCVNLFFTFPVMMHPVFEVAERWFCDKRYCAPLRWALVAVVCLVAVGVPNFADFLSLVGSSVCCLLGFVLPAAFHLRVFATEMGWAGVAADVALMAGGLVIAVTGTWSSLMDIFYSSKV